MSATDRDRRRRCAARAHLAVPVALLRSHAEILRRLHAIEDGDRPQRSRRAGAGVDPRGARRPAGAAAPDIVGETLAGDAVKLALGAGAPRTLLRSSAPAARSAARCGRSCARAGRRRRGSDRRRHQGIGPREPHAPDRIAPARGELVMSNAAWSDYGIPATPHFVLIDADARRILGRGSATSWSQILSLLADAQSDTELHRARSPPARGAARRAGARRLGDRPRPPAACIRPAGKESHDE